MPTADRYDPEGRGLIALDREAADARVGLAARGAGASLLISRLTQWDTEAGRNGERAEVLDARFDELEVRR